jgi:hypothetical protein
LPKHFFFFVTLALGAFAARLTSSHSQQLILEK